MKIKPGTVIDTAIAKLREQARRFNPALERKYIYDILGHPSDIMDVAVELIVERVARSGSGKQPLRPR